MRYVRMYATPDGESHFEDVNSTQVTAGTYTTDVFTALPVSLMRFVSTGASYDRGWHNAPLRQFVVTISGTWEAQVSDGQTRRFGPGSILLAEDVTGKGHTNRVDGPLERLMIHADGPRPDA